MSGNDTPQGDESVKLDISASSIIDLKAELFRKQEEFKRHKLQNENSSFVKGKATEKSKKINIFDRKNAGILERVQKDYEEKVQEEDKFEKSRKMLEAKAKVYEQLTQGDTLPDEDGSGRFLVDFEQKALDQYREERQKKIEAERKEAEEERNMITKDEDIPPPSDPSEEWVEYTDSLGRSRRCMRRDLDELIKQDKYLQQSSKSNSLPEQSATLLSQDMKREIQRQQWEKQEEEARLKDTIHYSDVQFDEKRVHGTGFYKLSGDEDMRKEQFDTLNKLRDESSNGALSTKIKIAEFLTTQEEITMDDKSETITERERRERLKAKRKAMLDARLAKVKQRKRMKEGGALEDPHPGDNSEEEIGPKIEDLLSGRELVKEKQSVNEEADKEKEKTQPIEDKLKRDVAMREWDKGKEKYFQMSGAKYMDERRQERISDFAPPTAFYDSSSRLPKKTPGNKADNKEIPQKTAQFSLAKSYTLAHSNSSVVYSGDDTMIESQNENVEEEIKETVSDIPLPTEGGNCQFTSKSEFTRDPDVRLEMPYQQPPPDFNSHFPSGEPTSNLYQSYDHSVIYNPHIPPPNIFQYMQQPYVNSAVEVTTHTFGDIHHQEQGPCVTPNLTSEQGTDNKDKLKIIDTRNMKNRQALETVEGEFVVVSAVDSANNERGKNISSSTWTDTDTGNTSTESTLSMQAVFSSKPILYKKDAT